jgi:Na+/melibiose symporter-like transporter
MSQTRFARLLAAEGVSNFGSMLSRLAVPWWAALGLGATPLQMSALLVADVLASALGGVLMAGWVDRHPKRRTMRACDGLRALLFGGLAACVWLGVGSMALLVAAAGLNGLLTAGFELSRSAWVAQQVPPEELPRRNAQLSATGSLTETLAFALGGWLYQALGAALALLVDALSFLVSALCLRGVAETPGVPPAAAPPVPRPGSLAMQALQTVWADASAGLHRVARHPGLRVLAAAEVLLAAGGGLFGTCFMIFVTRDLGLATGPLGLVFAMGGLGALLGAWAAPAAGRRWGAGVAMAAGLGLMTLGHACVPLAPWAAGMGAGPAAALVMLVLHQLVGDGGQVLHDIHDRTLRQTLVRPDQLAQADAGIRLAGQLSMLAAALAGGLVGDALGARPVLALAVALSGAAAVLVLARRSVLRAPGPVSSS